MNQSTTSLTWDRRRRAPYLFALAALHGKFAPWGELG